MKRQPQAKRRTTETSAEEARLLKLVGQKISGLAAKRQVSLERVAYEGGVSKGYLYDLAKGKSNPSLLILHRISVSLDVSLAELLGK